MFYCNRCLTPAKLFEDAQTGSVAQKWYLTNCNHILCQNCRVIGNTHCSECNRTFRVLEISRRMPQKYQSFLDPKNLSAQHMKEAQKFKDIQSKLIRSKMIAKEIHLKQKLDTAKQMCDAKQKTFEDKRSGTEKMRIIHNIIRNEAARRFVNYFYCFLIESKIFILFSIEFYYRIRYFF